MDLRLVFQEVLAHAGLQGHVTSLLGHYAMSLDVP